MKKTFYEKTLEYNFITKYLHQNKYRLLFDIVDKLINQNILNKNSTIKIIDIGCGPACIFTDLINKYDNINYIGIEPRDDFYEEALNRHSKDNRFTIHKSYCEKYLCEVKKSDIIIAFDCFEHIPLDKRNQVLDLISKIDFKYMFINVPNEIGPALLLKNIGSFVMGYVRHKEYKFIETIYASLYKINRFPPHIDAHKGFDWRVLCYNLRFYFDVSIKTSPNNLVPKCLSPSLFFICNKERNQNHSYMKIFR